MLKVFVGSTYLDLVRERSTVLAALQRLRATKFVGMEYFGSHDAGTEGMSFDELDRCELYIGVFGLRYGSGITESEYRRARDRGLPCLVYLKQAPAPGPLADAAQDRFRAGVLTAHSVSYFANADELATLVVADLHNLMFDRLLVAGMEQLHSDYDYRIRRFVEEYLGVPGQPVAFGGRDEQFAQLDAWLDGNDEPAYAMLVAPAGRGKSALLVHWVQRLMQRDALAVVFFPISVRFATSRGNVALAAIAARLAAIHNEIVPGGVETPVQVWRSILLSYLARRPPPGRRVLLVIDALDEAGDSDGVAQLLPRKPPPGLKVLASARTLAGDIGAAGWIARLKWDQPPVARSFELPPLTMGGLTRVLQTMGLPLQRLSRRVDIVRELFRLSGGDPLLVQLYVADLWARGEAVARLRPEDLAGIQPGLGGYFERWWTDQRELWGEHSPLREPLVNDILETLACALGPLLEDELLALLSRQHRTSVWGLEDAMRMLGRFIIGDGHQQGHAFSHPRLADHFFERLNRSGQGASYQQRYVDWGLAALHAAVAGEGAGVPLYVLQHLRSHMQRAGRPLSELMMFSGRDWARAWEPHDRGSQTGFLADVAQVAALATRADLEALTRGESAPYLAVELRCALAIASARRQAADLPASALAALVRDGRWSAAQAVAVVQKDADAERRCLTLLELADAQELDRSSPTLAAAGVELLSLDTAARGLRGLAERLHEMARQSHRAVYAARWLAVLRSLCRVVDQLPEERRAAVRALQHLPIDAPSFLGLKAQRIQRRFGDATARLRFWPRAIDERGDALLGSLLALVEAWREDRSLDSSEQQILFRMSVNVLPRLARQEDGPRRHQAVAAALAAFEALEASPGDYRRMAACVEPADAARLLGRLFAGRADAEGFDDAAVALARALGAMQRLALAPAGLRALARAGRPPGASLLQALFEGCNGAQVAPLLPLLADTLPPAALAAWLSVAIARREVEARDALAALHAVFERVPAGDETLAVVLALCDALAPPGHVDSLEGQRARPGLASQAACVRSALQAARAEPTWMSATLRGIVDRLPERDQPEQWRTMLDAGRWRLERPPVEPLPAAGVSNAVTAVLLWQQSRGGHDADDPASSLADVVRHQAGDALEAGIDLLAAVAPWLEREDKDAALESLCRAYSPYGTPEDGRYTSVDEMSRGLRAIVARLAEPPLFPPSPAALQAIADYFAIAIRAQPTLARDAPDPLHALPMPDLLREAWLAAAIQAQRRETGQFAAAQGVSAASARCALRLHHAPPALIAMAISGADGDALVELAPTLPPRLLPRWLAGVIGAGRLLHDRALAALARNPRFVDDAERWRELLEALRSMGEDALTTRWLGWVAQQLPEALSPDALRLARGVHDPLRRLGAGAILLPLLPTPEARLLVVELLAEAARGVGPPAMTRTLIQVAIARFGDDAHIVGRALDAALRIEDRALRADALMELSTVPGDEPIETALAQANAAEEAAVRVDALIALADAITDAETAATVVQRAFEMARSMRDGRAKARGLIRVARRLRGDAAYDALARAMAAAPDVPAGDARADALDDFARALTDAPFALLRRGVRWLAGLPADAPQEQAALRLWPALVPELQRHAISMLGRRSLLRAAPWLSADLAPRVRASARGAPDEAWFTAEFDEARGAHDGPTHAPAIVAELPRSDFGAFQLVKSCALADEIDAGVIGVLVQVAARIADPDLRRRAAAWLAPHAGAGLAEEAVAATRHLSSAAGRALAVARAARQAPETLRARARTLMAEALGDALRREDRIGAGRTAARIALATPEWWPTVLACLAAADDDARVAAWIGLAADASADMLRDLAAAIDDPAERARAIVRGAPWLSPAGCAAALAVVFDIPAATHRARAAFALAARLDGAQLDTAARLLDGIATDHAWITTAIALARRHPELLDAGRLERAASAVAGIDDEDVAGAWLCELASLCPPACAQALLPAAAALASPSYRSEALSCLLRHRPECVAAIASGLQAIKDPFHRVVLMLHTVTVGCGDPAQAISDCRRLGRRRAIDALALAVLRSGRALPAVFEALQTLRADPSVWVELAPHLDRRQAASLLDALPDLRLGAGVSTALAVRSVQGAAVAELILALTPVLDGPLQRHLVKAVERLPSPRLQSRVLCDLAPTLTDPGTIEGALDFALQMRDSTFRAESVAGLLSVASATRREEAWTAIVGGAATVATGLRLARLFAFLPSEWRLRLEAFVAALPKEAAPEPTREHRVAPDPALLAAMLHEAANSQGETSTAATAAVPATIPTWAERLRVARRLEAPARVRWLQEHVAMLPAALHRQAYELTWDLVPGLLLREAFDALLPVLGAEWALELHHVWAERVGDPSLGRGDVAALLPAAVPLLIRLGPADVLADLAAEMSDGL